MQRPDTVPSDATWEEDDSEWMLAPRDDAGELHGLVTWWRPDGTRCCATPFVHGTASGTFQRFHESGDVSRRGAFEDGTLQGTHTFWRNAEATSESFPAGLAEAVWRCEMDYTDGQIVEARAYDTDGHRVLEDGSPFPTDRPAGVPEHAHFRKREADGEWRWVEGSVRDNEDGTLDRQGRWRFWTPAGVLVSDEHYVEGQLDGSVRTFDDETGALVQESTWVHGDETGPFERHVDADHFADPRVTAERGQLDDGDRIGDLELLDAHGSVLHVVRCGDEPDQSAIGDVLGSDDPRAAIPHLEEHGQQVVAFLAGVLGGDAPAALVARLAALQPPLAPDAVLHETHRAKMVAHNIVRFGGGPVQLLSGLLGGVRAGGDAGELLRQAAASLDDMGAEDLATRLIDAACTLQPEQRGHEYTRALIRMSQGDPEAAASSIARLGEADRDAAAMLGSYRAALFADLRAPLSADPRLVVARQIAHHLPVAHREKAPPAAIVRRALQQIATRLGHAREGLAARFGEVPWLPPSLDHLLPDGPVDVELPHANGIGLLHEARRDILRLRWLCWCLGLDGRFLPDTVEVDDTRPSRALALVVLARALQLQDSEPDVSGWLDDLDDDVRGSLAAELAAATPTQTWYGMQLQDCDHAAKQFAFEDELVLFKMLLQWWNDGAKGTFYDAEADAEE